MSNNKTNNIYFFDSDVLIAAKSHYYDPCFASIFWAWLLAGINDGIFRTASNVKDELLDGNDGDYLKLLAQDVKFDDFWCDTQTSEIGSVFGRLQNWAHTTWAVGKNNKKNGPILANALTIFGGQKADSWLVALASHTQQSTGKKAFIVTNENSAPRSVNRVMLPDAAQSENVSTMRVFDLLRQHCAGDFQFQTPGCMRNCLPHSL